MTVYLIWDQFPEESDIYEIPDAPEWLVQCHGLCVNSMSITKEQTEMVMRVYDAVCPKRAQRENPDAPWPYRWAQYKLDQSTPIQLNGPALIVRCGFYL